MNTVTSNQECVSNIAESLVLSNLLLLLHSLPSSKKKTRPLVHFFVFAVVIEVYLWTKTYFLHYLGRQIVLETLYALTSNTKIVKEAMAKGQCNSALFFFSGYFLLYLCLYSSLCSPGALIYLLDLFCNCTHPQVRTQTAELFSKMTSDKLVGPKVCLEWQKAKQLLSLFHHFNTF